MFNDFFSDYLRGYNDDQLERARFMTLANMLIKKGVITAEEFKEGWKELETFLKDIVEYDCDKEHSSQ